MPKATKNIQRDMSDISNQLEMVDNHIRQSEYDLANSILDKVFQTVSTNKNKPLQLDLIKKMANCNLHLNNFKLSALMYNCYYAERSSESTEQFQQLASIEKKYCQVNLNRNVKINHIDIKKTIDELRQLRQSIQTEIPIEHSPNVQILMSIMTDGAERIFNGIIKDCMTNIGDPPCNFAIFVMGSFARNEMCPYSDVEYGILVERESPDVKAYFTHLAKLIDLRFINLGETKFPLLNEGKYSPTPSGFCIDTGGNSPLGKEGLFDLIRTPQAMAEFQQVYMFDADQVASNALGTVKFITGKKTLFEDYITQKNKVLDQNFDGTIIRQKHAIKLMRGDIVDFKPRLDFEKEADPTFGIKQELYRLPSSILNSLSLFYGIKASSSTERINKLQTSGYMAKEVADTLQTALNNACELRIRTQLYYEDEKEIGFYYPRVKTQAAAPYKLSQDLLTALIDVHPEFNSVGLSHSQIDLNADQEQSNASLYPLVYADIVLIEKTYQALIGLHYAGKVFCESAGQINPFTESDLLINDAIGIAKRLFAAGQFSEAIEFYVKATTVNPKDLTALYETAFCFYTQDNHSKSKYYFEKALAYENSIQWLNDTNPFIELHYYHRFLSDIYYKEGKLERSYECRESSLPAHLKSTAGDLQKQGELLGEMADMSKRLNKSEKTEYYERLYTTALINFRIAPSNCYQGNNDAYLFIDKLDNCFRSLNEKGTLQGAFVSLKNRLDYIIKNFPTAKHLHWRLCFFVGTIMGLTRKHDEAEKYLLMALDGSDLESYAEYPLCYYYLTSIYRQQRKFSQAIEILIKACNNMEDKDTHINPHLGSLYCEISRVYDDQGELGEAIQWAIKSLAFYEESPTLSSLSHKVLGTIYLAELYNKYNDSGAAYQHYLGAAHLLNDNGSLEFDNQEYRQRLYEPLMLMHAENISIFSLVRYQDEDVTLLQVISERYLQPKPEMFFNLSDSMDSDDEALGEFESGNKHKFIFFNRNQSAKKSRKLHSSDESSPLMNDESEAKKCCCCVIV